MLRFLDAAARMLRRSGAFTVAKRLLPERVAMRLSAVMIDRLRRKYAYKHLSGDGLEIGAMHLPLSLPPGARVRYVDRCSRDTAARTFPELDPSSIVEPDIIDDGFLLHSIGADSQQFVVGNHVLEHAPNPLQVLERWWEVLRPSGILFVAVPLHDRSFDRGRRLTTVEHMVEDYEVAKQEGPAALAARNADHYLEWASIAEPRTRRHAHPQTPEQQASRARALAAEGAEIHFHTFSVESFGELMRTFADRAHTKSIVLEFVELRDEVLGVLRKTGGAQGSS
jgi:SAM-dependent methyltransferase